MKNKLVLILYVVVPMILMCGCKTVSLPEDWEEQNKENSAFYKAVGSIDPKQTWNFAMDSSLIRVKSVEIDSTVSVAKFAAGYSESGSKAELVEVADFYRSDVGSFSMKCNSGVGFFDLFANCEVGLYYYDSNGKKVEVKLYDSAASVKYTTKDVVLDGGNYFGLYIAYRQVFTLNRYKFYSEAKLNEDGKTHTNLVTEGNTQFLEIITHDGDKIRFKIDKYMHGKPTISPVDYDKGPWTLLCEDLGDVTTSDNDLNDVVMVIHRTNVNEITIELSAAGAGMTDYIYWNGECLGEVHQLFGTSYTTDLVNTVPEKLAKKPQYVTKPHVFIKKTVEKSFTMNNQNMGGFIVKTGEKASQIYDGTKKVGWVPFMICVPGIVKWPIESIRIMDAYSTKGHEFSKWAQDQTQCKDWYQYPVAGKVYE